MQGFVRGCRKICNLLRFCCNFIIKLIFPTSEQKPYTTAAIVQFAVICCNLQQRAKKNILMPPNSYQKMSSSLPRLQRLKLLI